MCVSDTLFPRNSRQAAKRANFVSLDKRKKASGEGKTGVVVGVVVTGCGKASGGFHHIWKEGSAYAYAYAYAYAREHDFSNKCMVLNGFLRVCV